MQNVHVENGLEAVQVDFMNIVHDIHQKESEHKKKDKSRRRAMARRAIEMYQEKRNLEAELRESWETN